MLDEDAQHVAQLPHLLEEDADLEAEVLDLQQLVLVQVERHSRRLEQPRQEALPQLLHQPVEEPPLHKLGVQDHHQSLHYRLAHVVHAERVGPDWHLVVAQHAERAPETLSLPSAHALRQTRWLLLQQLPHEAQVGQWQQPPDT